VRESRQDEGWKKRLGTRIFYSMLHSGNRVKVPPNAGDFRLMDRSVVNALLQLPERNRFMKGLYAWVGFRSEPILYMPQSRLAGKSSFNIGNLWRLATTGLTSFTTWPLRVVSVIGMLVSVCAFLYGMYIVIEYLCYGNPIAGWPTIVTILLFFSGINLLSLGVVGEYIARIYDEVKGRPLYLVRQSLGTPLRRKGPEFADHKGHESHTDQNGRE
jgi:glycosyltransferase involved in cell wall biosynthesis